MHGAPRDWYAAVVLVCALLHMHVHACVLALIEWGLVCGEAATKWSGQLDYMTDRNSFGIPVSHMTAVPDSEIYVRVVLVVWKQCHAPFDLTRSPLLRCFPPASFRVRKWRSRTSMNCAASCVKCSKIPLLPGVAAPVHALTCIDTAPNVWADLSLTTWAPSRTVWVRAMTTSCSLRIKMVLKTTNISWRENCQRLDCARRPSPWRSRPPPQLVRRGCRASEFPCLCS